MSDKIMLLVDGSSYLYRAYHAMPDLRAGDGFPTGAIHGMVAMMKRLREQVIGAGPGGHAACVFDASGPTFRDDWYDQYKAQRAPMPDALREQIAEKMMAGGGEMEEFQERISPHELEDERRKEWLEMLWAQASRTAGLVSYASWAMVPTRLWVLSTR